MSPRLKLTELQLHILIRRSQGESYVRIAELTGRTASSMSQAVTAARKRNHCRSSTQLLARFAGRRGSRIVTRRNCPAFLEPL